MSRRSERIDQLIKEELSWIILKEFILPEGALTTITRVETASNLSQAKVFLSVLPEDQAEKVFESLNHRIYEIQQKFNKRVKMRPTPKLIFAIEKTTKEAGRIEELLEEIKEKD